MSKKLKVTKEMQTLINNAIQAGIQHGINQFADTAATLNFLQGFETGFAQGYIEGIKSQDPAISEGTRYGSPLCAKQLQTRKTK